MTPSQTRNFNLEIANTVLHNESGMRFTAFTEILRQRENVYKSRSNKHKLESYTF